MGSKSVLLRTLVADSSAKETVGLTFPVLYRSGAPDKIRWRQQEVSMFPEEFGLPAQVPPYAPKAVRYAQRVGSLKRMTYVGATGQ
jgi:hypothetical protein